MFATRICGILAAIAVVLGLCVLVRSCLMVRARMPLCCDPLTHVLLGFGVAFLIAAGAIILFLFRRIRYFGQQASSIAIDHASVKLGFLGAGCDLPRAQIASATIRRAARADTRIWAGASCPVAGSVLVIAMQDGFSPRNLEMPLYGLASGE
jgi:hypothetical protein